MAPKHQFDRDFQIAILKLLYQDHTFLVFATDVIDPSFFEDKVLVRLYQVIHDYYREYGAKITGSALWNEILKDYHAGRMKDEALVAAKDVFDEIGNPPLDGAYVQSELVRWAKRQAVRKAMLESAPLTDSEDESVWDTIFHKIAEAVRVGDNSTDKGVHYFKDFEARVAARTAGDDRIVVPTGITELDDKTKGGPRSGQLAMFMAATAGGKCLEKGTKVIKFDGSVVPVEDVKIGDLLMGPDSTPRRVLSTINGEEELCKITPHRGAAWVCTYDHILTLVHTETSEVVDIRVDDYLASNKTFRHCHKLFHSSAIDFPVQPELPIDPYFLGAWFGDGSKCLNNRDMPMPAVAVTSMDPEIRDMVYEMADKFGLRVREENSVHRGRASTYFLVGRTWEGEGHKSRGGTGKWENPLLSLIRSTVGPGASIPREYLTSSREDRASFLAGLIDTDGSVSGGSRGGYEITQKRRDYADSILFVARSLGLCANINQKMVNGAVYWRVHMSGDMRQVPIRIERKKPKAPSAATNPLRVGIKSIDSVGTREYYGFSLDGDHRFLLGDFTVTHNSIGLCHVGKAAVTRGFKVLHFTLELDEHEVSDRYDAAWADVNFQDLQHSAGVINNKLGALSTKYGDSLIIKAYPTKTASVSTLTGYTEYLISSGWKPDVIIVDYLDLLKPTTNYNSQYEDLGSIAGEIRGMGGTYRAVMWSATQANRSGTNAEIIDIEHIGDSLQKAQIADMIIAICMNREERANNKARLFLAKNRNGPGKVQIPIVTNYEKMIFYDRMATNEANDLAAAQKTVVHVKTSKPVDDNKPVARRKAGASVPTLPTQRRQPKLKTVAFPIDESDP